MSDFLLQRDFIPVLYADPQNAGQTVDHFTDFASFVLNGEHIDGFQGIKKKMRFDLRLQHTHLSLVFPPLLHLNPVKQHIDCVHQVVKALSQQCHLVRALLLDPCCKVAILNPAHKADNNGNPAGNPVHKEQVENYSSQETQEDHPDKPAGKHRHFAGQ
ncbi:hypothetical protein D3C81_1407870 [compost metagenome]